MHAQNQGAEKGPEMNTILKNSPKLKKVLLNMNMSALDDMWTAWKQQVKHDVEKTADQLRTSSLLVQ